MYISSQLLQHTFTTKTVTAAYTVTLAPRDVVVYAVTLLRLNVALTVSNDGCTNSCVAVASASAIYHVRVMGGKRPITLGRDKVKNRLS